jgi:uncharacterized membrane protein
MHTLVKAAAVIHQLSLAAAYGGPLFAKVGLRPAVKREIKDMPTRVRLMTSVWSKFNNKVNVPAHVLFTATWIVERNAILRVANDRRTRGLVHIKDVLITGALLTGVANVLAGKALKRELKAEAQGEATTTQKATLRKYRAFYKVMGPLNMALIAGSIAIGPAIGASIIRNQRRGLIGRLLYKLAK